MMLLTKADRAKLPQLYEQENEPDPKVWLKYFCPWSDWVWLATEGSGVGYSQRGQEGKIVEATDAEVEILCRHWETSRPRSLPYLVGTTVLGGPPGTIYYLEDFKLFGYVHGFEDELGYFSLREMEAIRGPHPMQGLGIERDLYFRPARLSEVLALHTRTHGWTPTWTPREVSDNE